MEYSSEAIIAGLRAKDQQVFNYLYSKYAGMISGHVIKNSGSREDAKELIQITMLDLWVAVRDGRYEEQGKLDRYVYQLAANSWREELRRRRYKPTQDLDDRSFQIADESREDLARAIVKDQYLQAIHEGINQMQSPCKEIIQLYHLKKMKLQHIAKEMNYDYNNLRKRIFDCRKKLKKIVEQLL